MTKRKEVKWMKVSIIGVTGYSGLELIRYLQQHPFVEIVSVHSQKMNKKSISTVFPHLANQLNLPLEAVDAQKIMAISDLVFLATPSGSSKELALPFLKAGFPVIDLSGDFRLKKAGTYEKWYGGIAPSDDYLQQFEYGLAEARKNPSAKWIANPGCYATVAELAFLPLLHHQLIQLDSVIIDAKSGLSGAGKKLTENSHFVEAHDNMSLYKMNSHQHIPEIVQLFQTIEPQLKTIQFSTSLIPVTRGIFLTGYAKLTQELTAIDLWELYQDFYQKNYFVRIQDQETYPNLKQVIGTNFCDIGLALNETTQLITLVATIDNLGKGAAGQAIQNLNLLAGYEETAGLTSCPIYP